MKRIIYTINGNLSVVSPVVNTTGEVEGFTEDDAIKRALGKIPPEAENVQIIERDAVPGDRTFRNAWEASGKEVRVNIPKARDIIKNKLREFRAERMTQLDIEYQRADEAQDTKKKSEVAVKKQVLRDLPAHHKIDSAISADELRNAYAEIIAEAQGKLS